MIIAKELGTLQPTSDTIKAILHPEITLPRYSFDSVKRVFYLDPNGTYVKLPDGSYTGIGTYYRKYIGPSVPITTPITPISSPITIKTAQPVATTPQVIAAPTKTVVTAKTLTDAATTLPMTQETTQQISSQVSQQVSSQIPTPPVIACPYGYNYDSVSNACLPISSVQSAVSQAAPVSCPQDYVYDDVSNTCIYAPTPTQKPVTPAVTPAITPVTPTPITAQISPTTIGIGIAIAIGLIAIFGHHKEVK